MHTTGVKVNVDVTSPPRAHRASLGCKSLSGPNRSIDQRSCWLEVRVAVRIRVRGISFLKTVNTLQVALQKHKGGDGLVRVGACKVEFWVRVSRVRVR